LNDIVAAAASSPSPTKTTDQVSKRGAGMWRDAM
jgi:hypothetical protein